MLRLGTSASDQGIDIADRAGELSCEGGAADDILENWVVSTENLDIVVADGLFNSKSHEEEQSHLRVTGDSTFSATSGRGEVSYWESRRTIVEFISGTIQGKFALRDLLSLKTVSGTITASVDPKEADPEDIVPAEFTAVTSSGTINIHFPTTGDIPSRDYRTKVEAFSGSIVGSYVGTETTMHTVSGSIYADLLPHYTETQPTVHTDCQSGRTTLTVLPPYSRHSGSIFTSEHKSTSMSGAIDIVYPQQWEGTIDGATKSGSISIKGEGVEIIEEQGKGKLLPVLRHVKARKGTGAGHMVMESFSGDVFVRVGDA
jgi:hypothetical protein